MAIYVIDETRIKQDREAQKAVVSGELFLKYIEYFTLHCSQKY